MSMRFVDTNNDSNIIKLVGVITAVTAFKEIFFIEYMDVFFNRSAGYDGELH